MGLTKANNGSPAAVQIWDLRIVILTASFLKPERRIWKPPTRNP